MFRYKLIVEGFVYDKFVSSEDIENPLPLFDCPPIVYNGKQYQITKENIDQELADNAVKQQAKEAAKLVAKDAKKALQAVKDADNLNKLQKATEDLAKVVHALVKVLDLTDPTEQSFL